MRDSKSSVCVSCGLCKTNQTMGDAHEALRSASPKSLDVLRGNRPDSRRRNSCCMSGSASNSFNCALNGCLLSRLNKKKQFAASSALPLTASDSIVLMSTCDV